MENNSENSEKAEDSKKTENSEKVEEQKEESFKEDRIRNIALVYYSRSDIRKAIFDFSKDREVVPRYFEGFGKRPDSLQYDSDILAFVKKGCTSLHCSEELWRDPLAISTELSEEQFNELRKGWDLLIDVDSKYLDYSKIASQLLVQALEFHGVKNIGVKFSGSRGFHIIIPWKSFPEIIHGVETKNMFPEWPRMICLYLTTLIKKQLIEKISDLMYKDKEGGARKSYVKDFEAPKQVMPDVILVSPRHLFRAPYSLHEKTSLASVVINKNEIEKFKTSDANPLRVQVKNFYPTPLENESSELLVQAIDWAKSKQKTEEKAKAEGKTIGRKGEYKEIIIKDLTPNLFPPCITNILQGVKQDGRKRALFILINFFKSLKLKDEEIEEKIKQWNNKNYKPLKQGYVRSQLSWHSRQKPILPPNCDKTHYKDLAVCKPDNLCKMIKNPINYTIKKSFLCQKCS